MRNPWPLMVISAVTILLIAYQPSVASTLIPRDFSELVRNSDLIVMGRCIRTAALWQDRLIFTRVELFVEQTLKGAASKNVEFFVPGGEVDGIRMEASGVPSAAAGERMMVFLARNPSGRMRVYGAVQGKFDVVLDSDTGVWLAMNPLVTVTVPEGVGLRLSVSGARRGSRVPLQDLVSAVRVWLGTGGVR